MHSTPFVAARRHWRLVAPRRYFVMDGAGAGSGQWTDNPHFDYVVGQIVAHSVAAPGYGMITYRIIAVDAEGAWGIIVRDDVRIFTPGQVR